MTESESLTKMTRDPAAAFNRGKRLPRYYLIVLLLFLVRLPSVSKWLERHVSARVLLFIVLNEHIQSCGGDAGGIQALRPLHEADSCGVLECQHCNTTPCLSQFPLR